MKALIVDDSPIVLSGLKKMLPWKEMGIQLIGEALNGEEGYNKVMELQPDLVITDVKMPIMSGIDMCREIYKSPIQPEIIILSAYEDFEYAKEAMRYGVKNYILKPISRDKINELKSNIATMKEVHRKHHAMMDSIINEDLERDLKDALAKQDMNYVKELFRSHLIQLYSSKEEGQQLAIRIVNCIYEYFTKIGVNLTTVLTSKANTLERLLAYQDTEDMFHTLENMLMQILQFSNDNQKDIVELAVRKIHSHFHDEDLSVADLARELYITPTYLSVLFKKSKGMTISSYITELRFQKAKDMLQQTSLKVVDIANKVGYRDPKYFSKVFKKQTGFTPSNYRYQHISRE